MSLISSQASAVSASDSKEPGCELLPSARSSHTPAPSCESTGPTSPAMTTSEPSPLTASTQTELFPMSSVAAFPARTSAAPARGPGWMANAAAYGLNTGDLLASFDRDTSSWRTSQHSLEGGLDEFSETWPRSGTTRSGIAYQLPPLVRLTDETDFGLWPTPMVPNGGRSVAHVNDWRGRTAYHNGKKVQVDLRQAVKLWPTPTVMYTRENWPADKLAAKRAEVKAATEAKGDHHTGNGFGLNLAQAVRMWPTPNAGDYKAGMSNAPNRQQSSLPRTVGIVEGVSSGRRGGLNPTWVEWLMGFPLQWTALRDSETPSSRKSRKSSVKP
jgi:hypothetical protein